MTFRVPIDWGATKDQITVIESLMEFPGRFVSPEDLVDWVFDETLPMNAPAPAKLRVLIQRTRATLESNTKSEATIGTKRGRGYRITKRHSRFLQKLIEV